MMKLVSSMLWFGLAATACAQAPQPAPPSTGSPAPGTLPTFKVAAREVQLDVVVTDKNGTPITGLTKADFTVAEEGTPQVVKSVQEHVGMSAEAVAKLQQTRPLPPNTFSNFTPALNTNAQTVILLDALDASVQTQMYMRDQLIGYLKHMQPGASIAIFQLDTEMHLIQGFSSDQQVLLAAAKSKRDMPSMVKPASGYRASEDRRVRRIVLREGLRQMGRYLAAFPGRKNLIWLTGEEPLARTVTGLGNPFSDTVDVVEDGDNGGGEAIDILNISHVAIYPIDARGLLDVGPREAARINFQNLKLEQVAEDTGGRAYYSSNGIKEAIEQIVGYGSNYYTLAYSTTNKDWNRERRQIKVSVNRPGVQLQYRHFYFAVNREQQEARKLAALQKRAAAAGKPEEAEAAAAEQAAADKAAEEAEEKEEAKEDAAQQAAASGVATGTDKNAMGADGSAKAGGSAAKADGEVIHPAKSGLEASMALGAIPATEIVFTASLTPVDQVLKLDKNAQLAANNFLRPEYRNKPFRNYEIAFHADAHSLKLTRSADGSWHGSVEFVSVVYSQTGEVVNSQLGSATLDLKEAVYRQFLKSGLGVRQEIAIPVKGNYFLRLGVHDATNDQIGALEIPVDQVKLGVAGAGHAAP